MALTIRTGPDPREMARAASALRADRSLWLTAAKDRIVEAGHVEAAFLFAAPGDGIGVEEAQRYGLTWQDGRVALPGAEGAAP